MLDMNERDRKVALHLIAEDLKYHQMVAYYGAVEVHIEFFPDFATAVKDLLGQAGQDDSWEDRYVIAMRKAENVMWGDKEGVKAVAAEVLEMLNDEL